MQVTTRVALAGAADTALFLVRRPQMFRDARGRALGSTAFGALWLALAASSFVQRPGRVRPPWPWRAPWPQAAR